MKIKVKIITDSCADLPQTLYDQYEIGVIPLDVILKDKSYQDRVEMTADMLMTHMKTGQLPKTSQISVSRFERIFKDQMDAGYAVIYIGLSSGLSGTYESACMAREEIINQEYGGQLYVMDSKSATLGQGLIVLQAAKMAKENRPVSDILKGIAKSAETTQHLFLVEDLNHLYRGGRLSKTSAVVGSIMSVHPLLTLEEGRIKKLESIRGQKKANNRLKELTLKALEGHRDHPIGISHGDKLEQASQLKAYLESKGFTKIILNDVGAVIGSHTGPGYLGVFF